MGMDEQDAAAVKIQANFRGFKTRKLMKEGSGFVMNESNIGVGEHWISGQERRGMGYLWNRVNHIAIIVSDVGESLYFYTDILGMQQIRRPNFDRHGAWVTMGNLELHLIKGRPVVHSGEDLICSHMALECHSERMNEVLKNLKDYDLDFRQNVSVPKAHAEENAERKKDTNIVEQYFLRDPDGYYIELCNCDILTKFCLGKEDIDIAYSDTLPKDLVQSVTKMLVWSSKAKKTVEGKYSTSGGNGNIPRAKEVDELKLRNLLKRTVVYGDITQGQTETSLRELLLAKNNMVPEVIRQLYKESVESGVSTFIPPSFYDKNDTKVVVNGFTKTNNK